MIGERLTVKKLLERLVRLKTKGSKAAFCKLVHIYPNKHYLVTRIFLVIGTELPAKYILE